MEKTIDIEWASLRLRTLIDILGEEMENLEPSDTTNRVLTLEESIRDLAQELYDVISELDPERAQCQLKEITPQR